MPDLNIEIHYTCDTNLDWSIEVEGSKGAKYTVTWDRYSHKNQNEVQYDFSCTCHAYKFGQGKYCKHIEIVKDERCGWDGFMEGGDVIELNGKKVCPKCKGSVTPIRHGV